MTAEHPVAGLRNLYDQVVEGGYLIVDDYGHFPGCRKAVDEFFRERSLRPDWRRIDYTGVFMRKGAGAAAGPVGGER